MPVDHHADVLKCSWQIVADQIGRCHDIGGGREIGSVNADPRARCDASHSAGGAQDSVRCNCRHRRSDRQRGHIDGQCRRVPGAGLGNSRQHRGIMTAGRGIDHICGIGRIAGRRTRVSRICENSVVDGVVEENLGRVIGQRRAPL